MCLSVPAVRVQQRVLYVLSVYMRARKTRLLLYVLCGRERAWVCLSVTHKQI